MILKLTNIYASVDQVLNTKDEKLMEFSVYPNPAARNITINYSETIDNICIYSLLGQKLLKWTLKIAL